MGLFFSAYSASAVLMRLGLGWVPDRIGAKKSLYPAVLFLTVGLLLLANVHSPMEIAVAGVLAGTGHGFVFPILAGLVVAPRPRGLSAAPP